MGNDETCSGTLSVLTVLMWCNWCFSLSIGQNDCSHNVLVSGLMLRFRLLKKSLNVCLFPNEYFCFLMANLTNPNNKPICLWTDTLLCVLSVAGDGRLLVHVVLLFIKTPFFIIIYHYLHFEITGEFYFSCSLYIIFFHLECAFN